MASYICFIKFDDTAGTKVVADYQPAPVGGGFDKGEDITFTSDDGPWHVIYTNSPFHDQPQTLMISASKGQRRRFFVNGSARGGHLFKCLIDKDGQSVGWDSAGGDTHVKTT